MPRNQWYSGDNLLPYPRAPPYPKPCGFCAHTPLRTISRCLDLVFLHIGEGGAGGKAGAGFVKYWPKGGELRGWMGGEDSTKLNCKAQTKILIPYSSFSRNAQTDLGHFHACIFFISVFEFALLLRYSTKIFCGMLLEGDTHN